MGLFSSCFQKEDDEMIELPIGTIRKLVRNYLQKEIPSKLGYLEGIENCSVPDVDICTDVLMYAELRGNNQGIVKLLSNALKENPNAEAISVTHESSVSAKVNGGQRIGMCVVSRAVDIAIKKATKSKIGIVGCSNYSSATGAIGYWARKIAKSGNIAIVMSQCNELVAPHGSYEPIFGTNP
jgi:LDH2 family malate/lactate/ureidoglycolate dehydrogenase